MENENLNEELQEEAVSEVLPEQEPVTENLEAAQEEMVNLTEEAAEEIAEEVAEEAAEETAEEAAPVLEEKKQSKAGMIVVIALLSVALLGALVLVVLMGTGVVSFNNDKPQETTEAVETTLPLDLKSYTVDAETARAMAENVVATVGDVELTNGEMQVYYWMAIYDFVSANSYYLPYMNVDFSQPLDQQVYNATDNTTWQEAMLDYALQNWHRYMALNMAATEAGYELDEEGQQYMAEMETNIQSMLDQAGYTSLEEMLEKEMGAGASEKGYRGYMTDGYRAVSYYNDCYEQMKPNQEQIEQYFAENEQILAENGITKDSGNLVDVRHILIKPQGGTTDEAGAVTYSEEEWETCRQTAQEILDQWKSGEATEESFGLLAGEKTEDTGSKSTGGLYQGVPEGQMVPEFNDWIFDEARVYGDTDLVKTTYGYHIMYFVKSEPAWITNTGDYYLNEKMNELVDGAMEKWPMQTDYDAIGLGESA